jgi:hypothetical protein
MSGVVRRSAAATHHRRHGLSATARRTALHARRSLHARRTSLHALHARRPLHAWRTSGTGATHALRRTLHARRTSGTGTTHALWRTLHARRTSGTGTTHALRRTLRRTSGTSRHRSTRSSVHDRLREPGRRRTGARLVRHDGHRPTCDHDLVAGIDGRRLYDLVPVEIRTVGRAAILELKPVADPTDLAVVAGDTRGLQAQVVAFTAADRHGRTIEGQQLRGLALFADRNSNHGAPRD